MPLLPNFWTTTVGSFPHLNGELLSAHLVDCLDIPAWPQLSKRSFFENMYVQFSRSLPGIQVDALAEKIIFNTRGDLTGPLESFYERYLADDLGAFALTPKYAQGFYDFQTAMGSRDGGSKVTAEDNPDSWVKGQVTGPISLGLTVTDQDLRASLYDEMLVDVLVKNAAMHARWQARRLKELRPNVIIAVDEPYMAAFGSAFISLSREMVIAILDEVFEAIHSERAHAWVHCCANTDWSVLLGTTVDILNLDAYGYLENLALYPAELHSFLDRGGAIAWGVVPNNAEIFDITAGDLAARLRQGFDLICRKAAARGVDIYPEELAAHSLLTTSCGLGPASVEIADRAVDVLINLGEILSVH